MIIPTPKQIIAARLINPKVQYPTELFFGGAAGGAKSFFGCLWLLSMCTTYPESKWLMARAKLKTLKETTLATFFDVVKKAEYDSKYFKYYDSSHIQFKNGSQIILKDLFFYPSDPDFNSLGSLELTGGFIDETPEITRKAKDVVRTRLRWKLDEYGLHPKLLMAGNPSKNWTYSDFYKPHRDGTLPIDKAFIQSLVTDNKHIAKSYVNTLEGIEDTVLKDRLLHGNWEYEVEDNSLIDIDAIVDSFSNSFVYIPGSERYISADIALHGSDKFVIGVWFGMTLVKVVCIDKSDGETVPQIIKNLATEYAIPMSRVVYDSDGIGGFLKAYLPNAVSFVANAAPIGKDNYANLKAQCTYVMAKLFNDRRIYIQDRKFLSNFERELQYIRRKPEVNKLQIESKEVIKQLLGHSPDFADMLMMRMYFEIKPVRRSSYQ